jgi:pimeloyl-ACP methyl ester carboxylesterase
MSLFQHRSGEYLDVDGASIYYESTGAESGPILLFLHGGMGSIEDFNAALPLIDKRFRIVGIDSRGHGKSTLGTTALTYERLQKDTEAVIKYLDIEPVNIVGFSDGGIVAYRLASLTSLEIDKVVAIGATWHPKNLEATRDIFLGVTAESWKTKFPESYRLYEKLNPDPDFDSLIKATVRMWLDTEASGRPGKAVRNITCPLLIVRGDNDHLVSREAVFELAKYVETAMLFNIPFAGHVAHSDQKDVFALILNQFLTS